MDITHYAFATYVFILVCAGMWLFGRLVARKPEKKQKAQKEGYEKEQRLFNLYQNIEDLLAGFEEFTEEARAEAERTKAQIAAMLEQSGRVPSMKTQTDVAVEVKPPVVMPHRVQQMSTVARAKYKATAEIHTVRTDAEETNESKEQAVPHLQIVEKAFARPDESKPARTGEKVLALAERGIDKTGIAQHLGISVREVTLAMKLNRSAR